LGVAFWGDHLNLLEEAKQAPDVLASIPAADGEMST
jgi:hypothetical protein